MVAAFARPLPGQVFFSEILDLPDDELEHCQELVERAVFLNNVEQMVAAQTELNEYVRMLVARRQAEPPGDDLLGAVVHAEINGEQVPVDDAVSIVTMLIFGGLETTTNTLGSTLLQLGRDQELQRRLRDNPELLSASVEEFLRLHAPTIYLSRYVTRPTVLEGLSIEAGQRVALSFAAANRDPKIFENPDESRAAAQPPLRVRGRHSPVPRLEPGAPGAAGGPGGAAGAVARHRGGGRVPAGLPPRRGALAGVARPDLPYRAAGRRLTGRCAHRTRPARPLSRSGRRDVLVSPQAGLPVDQPPAVAVVRGREGGGCSSGGGPTRRRGTGCLSTGS
jgi:hypothetical protein